MCPQLDITENFADNTVLTQAQLHRAFLDMEDFVNLTKLDEENIQAGSLTNLSLADQTLTTAKYGTASITLAKLAQEVTDRLVPAGSVMAFAGTSIPSGWLYCDGSAVSRTVYGALFLAIGVAWGNGDGSSTFNIPDLKGRFLRGQDDGAARDPDASSRTAPALGGNTGDAVGSVQDDATAANGLFNDGSHSHFLPKSGGPGALEAIGGASVAVTNSPAYPGDFYTGGNGGGSGSHDTINSSDNETRPINAYVRYIIKV